MLIAGLAASAICMIYGFANNGDQKTALDEFSSQFGAVSNWGAKSRAKVTTAQTELTEFSASVTTAINYFDCNDRQDIAFSGCTPANTNVPLSTFEDNMDPTDSSTPAGSMKTALDAFEAVIAGLDGPMSSFGTQELYDTVDSVESYRFTGVLWTWLGILILLTTQAFMSFWKMRQEKKAAKEGRIYKRGKLLGCLDKQMAIVFIFAFFLIWILTVVLYGISTVTADLCYDPDTVMLENFNKDGTHTCTDSSGGCSDQMTYFLKCDELPVSRQETENAAASEFTAMDSAFDDLSTHVYQAACQMSTPSDAAVNCAKESTNPGTCTGVTLWTNTEPRCQCDAAGGHCSETSAMVAAMLTAFTELRTASGARAVGETHAREGVYEILSCKTMNGMYISLLHYLCGTMLDPVSSCALLLLFTGIILFASDVTKLCVRVKGEGGDYSSNKVGPEEESNGIEKNSQKVSPAITSEADF